MNHGLHMQHACYAVVKTHNVEGAPCAQRLRKVGNNPQFPLSPALRRGRAWGGGNVWRCQCVPCPPRWCVTTPHHSHKHHHVLPHHHHHHNGTHALAVTRVSQARTPPSCSTPLTFSQRSPPLPPHPTPLLMASTCWVCWGPRARARAM